MGKIVKQLKRVLFGLTLVCVGSLCFRMFVYAASVDNDNWTWDDSTNTLTIKTDAAWYNGSLMESGMIKSGYSDVTYLVVEEGVGVIPSSTFSSCVKLIQITIRSEKIGIDAFGNCTSLSQVTLLEGVEEIGFQAFDNCSSLTDIEIPASVTKIESNVFEDTGLTSITFSDSASGLTIDEYAFNNCNTLQTLTINSTNKEYTKTLITALNDGMDGNNSNNRPNLKNLNIVINVPGDMSESDKADIFSHLKTFGVAEGNITIRTS